MIDKEDAVAIVRVVILHHFSPEYDAELNKENLSKWDEELFAISKEICTRIRGEVTE